MIGPGAVARVVFAWTDRPDARAGRRHLRRRPVVRALETARTLLGV